MHNRQVRASSLLLAAILLSAIACSRRNGRTAYVELPANSDFREGAPVRFQGFEIGRVQKVTLRRTGVLATLLIQRADAPMQSNDRVAVHPVGIFGDQALDILPAAADGPPLRDGDTLHAAPVDSLAPAREALTRALVHEFTQRLLRSDKLKRVNSDTAGPRP